MQSVLDAAADRRLAWVCVVAAVATGGALRFTNLDWDLGFLLHPDEYNLIAAAARWNLDWGSDPGFYAYGGLSLALPLLIAKASAWLDPAVDPLALQILSGAMRLASACASTIVIVIAAALARLAFVGPLAPWMSALTAWLVALDVAQVQAAHFGTTDSMLVLALLALCMLAALYLRGDLASTTFVGLTGAILGLAIGLKVTAVLFALVPATAMLLRWRQCGLGRLCILALSGAALVVVFLVLTSPHIVLYPSEFLATMKFEGDVVAGRADVFWTFQFRDAPLVLFAIAQMPWLHGPFVPGLGFAGILVLLFQALRRQERAIPLLPAAVFAAVYYIYICGLSAPFVRYLLPPAPLLIVAAVWIVNEITRPISGGGYSRKSGIVVGALLCASGLWCAAFTSVYAREDTRIQASRWLRQQIVPGSRILIEPHDNRLPLPVGASTSFVEDVLPLLDPYRPELVQVFADKIWWADYIVVATRRHSHVLPRLPARFPVACAYYRALFKGDLGTAPVVEFESQPKVLGITVSTERAEETFQVFDHPTVRIFRNDRTLSHSKIIEVLGREKRACESQASTPLRVVRLANKVS
jgi:hypothetical protein